MRFYCGRDSHGDVQQVDMCKRCVLIVFLQARVGECKVRYLINVCLMLMRCFVYSSNAKYAAIQTKNKPCKMCIHVKTNPIRYILYTQIDFGD